MILFTIKKTFFDAWDHLFSLFFINFGFLIMVGIGIYAVMLCNGHPLLFVSGILIVAALLVFYLSAVSMLVRDVADYKAADFKKFWPYLKETWRAALALVLILLFQGAMVAIVLPFYARMQNIPGILAAAMLFWINVIWVFASQYYFPVRGRLDTRIMKVLRKSLLVFFDNTPFTLALGLGTLLMLLLSSVTAFLFPGISGILLWHQVGFKLRMYKYDYLEQHPEAKRTQIPWDSLLQTDRERVGQRTLRGMIFPWKE